MKSYPVNYVGIYHALAKTQYEFFERYSEDIESSIESKIFDLIEFYEKETKEFTQQELEEFWEFHYDDFHDIKTNYPNTHRSTMLIKCYTLFEKTLVDIFYRIQTKLSLQGTIIRDLKDLKKKLSTIGKVRYILLHDAKFPFPTLYWDNIESYRKIRNIITHEDSKVNDHQNPQNATVKLISSVPHVDINSSGEIIFSEEFTAMIIKDMKGFLDLIFKETRNFNKKIGI